MSITAQIPNKMFNLCKYSLFVQNNSVRANITYNAIKYEQYFFKTFMKSYFVIPKYAPKDIKNKAALLKPMPKLKKSKNQFTISNIGKIKLIFFVKK